MKKHIVISYPHPDDESFGAAGVIHKYKNEGVPITYLCGTLGEMGRNMGNPTFANRETLPKIREAELKEACDYLGIDYKLLGYRDKTMEFENEKAMANHIKTLLEELEPSHVFTHYPGHGVHPDHNAQAKATIEAVRLMDEDKRPTVYAAAITKNYEEELGQPEVVFDVEDYFDFKVNAIFKHKSQAEGMLKKFEEAKESNDLEFKQNLKQRLGKEKFFIWKF